ncbi:MAG: class I SAM-dependent methyltransferase [Chitinophagaceae bacterium]|jgi:SAM-dependent methyltransferase
MNFKGNHLESDAELNQLYPMKIQNLAKRHWTPLHIAQLAASFLGDKRETKVLDIGSGVGKFCIAGACLFPDVHFYGIEQRANLIEHAKVAQKKLNIQNATFINGCFTELDLKEFDSFYFFNSFHENIDENERIDEDIEYSDSLYRYYMRYLYFSLELVPKGTKLVTYHCYFREVPNCYEVVDVFQDAELIFWIKKR